MKNNNRQLRLQLKEIIDDLDANSIKSFILHYASHDRTFEMAFKSHFISRIRTSHDESKKYKRVLEEVIKPKNAHNKIGPSQKKMISIIFKDFVLQMNDLLSTNDFKEAYYLIKESLDKIAYLQNRYLIKDNSIELCRRQFLVGLDLILIEELAPAFRQKIESELKELPAKSYFIPNDGNILELLNSRNILIKEEKSNYIEELFAKAKGKDEITPLIKTVIQLSYPFPELAKLVLHNFNHDKIFNSVRSLIYEGKFEFVDFYINNKDVEFKYNREILNVLKHVEKADYENLSSQLNDLIKVELNLIDLKLIVDALPESYLNIHYDFIKKWISSLPFHLKIELYAKSSRNELLIEQLANRNDIEWLKYYDKLLIARDLKKEVQKLYIIITSNYISDHIGIKTREYLHKVQLHLSAIDEYQIYEKLHSHIYEKYNHRISLTEDD